MAPLNVGLMGYGSSTKIFHLPFIIPNPDLNVYAFLQRAEAPPKGSHVESGKHCTIDFPEAKHYRTADEFFADPKIDLVIVCTKHDTHAEFAEKALLAGKHVVVEKPFTATTAEADHVLATAAKTSNKILTVYQNRRYDSDFLTLQTLLSKSALGKITECEIHFDVDFPPWVSTTPTSYKPGTGMLYGLGSHTIDQALTLFGPPSSVTGFCRFLGDPAYVDAADQNNTAVADDTFTVLLQYGKKSANPNLLVTVKTSIVAAMRHPLRFFVRGYDGTFVKHGGDPKEEHLAKGMPATDEGFGVEEREVWGELTTKTRFCEEQSRDERSGLWVGRVPSERGDWADYYRDVVSAIRGGGEVKIRPEQSRDGIRIIELARESARAGRTLMF